MWLISLSEESCDISSLSIVELRSKLQAQEQWNAIWNLERLEHAIQYKAKGKKKEKGDFKKIGGEGSKEKVGALKKEKFPPYLFCKKKKKKTYPEGLLV